MKQTAQTEKVVAAKVARREMSGDSKLFFLFTAMQVEEVLSEVTTRPVPFAPSFLSGVAFWRGHLLPVIDLEERFAFTENRKTGKTRFLVVRTGVPDSLTGAKVMCCVLQLSETVNSIDAPASCTAVSSEEITNEPSLVRGAYQYREDIYIVPDLVSILQNDQSSNL